MSSLPGTALDGFVQRLDTELEQLLINFSSVVQLAKVLVCLTLCWGRSSRLVGRKSGSIRVLPGKPPNWAPCRQYGQDLCHILTLNVSCFTLFVQVRAARRLLRQISELKMMSVCGNFATLREQMNSRRESVQQTLDVSASKVYKFTDDVDDIIFSLEEANSFVSVDLARFQSNQCIERCLDHDT